MNPRHLEFVVGVADHRSFTRAAEVHHVSQPSLSQAIAGIEAQLGTPLFRRTGRSVSPTAAGDAFVEAARLVLRDISLLYASVKPLEELQAGRLDVAAPPAAAAGLLAHLIAEIRAHHPRVRVRIETSENPHDIERCVRTGRCELAVTVEPVEPPLVAEIIGREEYVVAFPPGTKLRRLPVKHADLAGRPMIVPAGLFQYHGGFTLRLSSSDEAPVVAVESESRQAMVPLVLAGVGFTFLPRPLAAGAACQGAVVAELDPPLERDISLVTRPGPLSPAARAFASIARSRAVAGRTPSMGAGRAGGGARGGRSTGRERGDGRKGAARFSRRGPRR